MLSVLALRRVLYASRSRCFSTRALVGFIGIGKMGKNLVRSPTVPHVRSQLLSVQAANLLSGGFDVLAYDSSASALSEVTALGARTASSAAAVAQQTNTIITMLPNDAILDSVVNELVAHFKGAFVCRVCLCETCARRRAPHQLLHGGTEYITPHGAATQ
jgi:3-hydroxyisobutyrate dehydrogenase-like beta-hydroxyacid dehydrogenase